MSLNDERLRQFLTQTFRILFVDRKVMRELQEYAATLQGIARAMAGAENGISLRLCCSQKDSKMTTIGLRV